jgi:hypothetical protein
MMRIRTIAVLACVSLASLGARPALAQDPEPAPPTSPAPSEPTAPAPAEPTPPASPAPAAPAAPTRTVTPINPSYTAGEATSGPTRDTDEKKDSGLGLEWLWLDAGGGFAYANMASFDSSNLALQNTEGSGGTFSVGAGVRLFSFTAGLRGRGLLLSTGNLVEIDGEVGLHTRIDHFETYFGLRGGYAFSGTLSSDTVSSAAAGGGTPPNVDVHGVNAGGLLGFEYYFNHYVSLGLDLNPEMLFLQRPPNPSLPSNVPDPSKQPGFSQLSPAQQNTLVTNYNNYQTIRSQSGSSVGFGFIGTAHLGLHF